MLRCFAFALLLVLALWTGLVWSEPVRGDGLAVPITLSRTTELDVNLWSSPPNGTITVWQQDLSTGANTRLARLFLPAWAVWVSFAGVLIWLVGRQKRQARREKGT